MILPQQAVVLMGPHVATRGVLGSQWAFGGVCRSRQVGGGSMW